MPNVLWSSPETARALTDEVVQLMEQAQQKADPHGSAVRECQLREHRINNLIRCIAALEDVMADKTAALKAGLMKAAENLTTLVDAVTVLEQQGAQKDSLISELRAQLASGTPISDSDLAALQELTDEVNSKILRIKDELLGMEGDPVPAPAPAPAPAPVTETDSPNPIQF